MSSLLTTEEMDALRADLADAKQRTAELVDLAGGEQALRRVVPLVERRLELLEPAIEAVVTRTIRETIHQQSAPPEVIGPRTALQALQELSIVAEIHADKVGLIGFMGLEKHIGFFLIERAFGAALDTGPLVDDTWAVPARARLTDVERSCLEPLMAQVAQQLQARVFEGGMGEMTLRVVPMGLTPELPSQTDSAIIWKSEFSLGSHSSGLKILLLPSLVEILLRNESVHSRDVPKFLQQHIAQVSVSVEAILGQSILPLRDFLGLRPGHIVRLDRGQNDAVMVCVSGVQKMVGKPIQRNGAFAIEIEAEKS